MQSSKRIETTASIRRADASEPATLSLTIAVAIEIPDLRDKAALNRMGRRLDRLICDFGGSVEAQEKAKEELHSALKQAAHRARLRSSRQSA